MTLVRLKDGKFIAIDAVDPQGVADGQKYKGELKDEIDRLTLGGTLLEAVVATHPFHSLGFESFYEVYGTGKTRAIVSGGGGGGGERRGGGGGGADGANQPHTARPFPLKFYGTPRHLRRLPSIPWAGDSGDTTVHGLWKSRGVEMRLPQGRRLQQPYCM